MSVESERIDKRVEWLDQQRRKDAETISRLTERLSALESAIESQDGQLSSIASEIARLAALAPRLDAFDGALDKHRKDVNTRFEEGQSRLISRQKDLESMWKGDQKRSAESADELRTQLGGLKVLEEELALRRSEESRLRKAVDAQRADIEKLHADGVEASRMIAALEERRLQESKRVGDLESKLTGLRAGLDSHQGAVDSSADRIRRAEQQVDQVVATVDELREAQRLWREQQATRLAEFQREWSEWKVSFEAFSSRADELDERIVVYEETFRGLLQLKADLKEIIERLERRITEVSELQRLAEERFKQEWSTFKSDDQKRWTGFQLASDERWKDHQRMHERLDARIEVLEPRLDEVLQDVSELAAASQARIRETLALIQEWASEIERSSGST